MDGLKYGERQLEDIWIWECWSQVYGHNRGTIVYLLLMHGMRIHKARCSALAYLITQNPLTPLLKCD
jgi:hypothetical protein